MKGTPLVVNGRGVHEKTMVVYGLLASTNRAIDPGKFVAYDKGTGATLGEVTLPSAPIGTPMTYARAALQRFSVVWRRALALRSVQP